MEGRGKRMIDKITMKEAEEHLNEVKLIQAFLDGLEMMVDNDVSGNVMQTQIRLHQIEEFILKVMRELEQN